MEHEGQVVRSRNMQAVRPPEAAAGQPQQLARGGHAPHHEAVSLRRCLTLTLSEREHCRQHDVHTTRQWAAFDVLALQKYTSQTRTQEPRGSSQTAIMLTIAILKQAGAHSCGQTTARRKAASAATTVDTEAYAPNAVICTHAEVREPVDVYSGQLLSCLSA